MGLLECGNLAKPARWLHSDKITHYQLTSAVINYSSIFFQKLIGLTKNINSPGLATVFCLLHRLGATIPERCVIYPAL